MLVIAVMMVLSRFVVEQGSASRSDLSDPDVVGVPGDREGDAGRHDHEVIGLSKFLFHRVADGARHHLLVGAHLVRPHAVRAPEQAETPRGREVRGQGQDRHGRPLAGDAGGGGAAQGVGHDRRGADCIREARRGRRDRMGRGLLLAEPRGGDE
jgi:hypothetical protein